MFYDNLWLVLLLDWFNLSCFIFFPFMFSFTAKSEKAWKISFKSFQTSTLFGTHFYLFFKFPSSESGGQSEAMKDLLIDRWMPVRYVERAIGTYTWWNEVSYWSFQALKMKHETWKEAWKEGMKRKGREGRGRKKTKDRGETISRQSHKFILDEPLLVDSCKLFPIAHLYHQIVK